MRENEHVTNLDNYFHTIICCDTHCWDKKKNGGREILGRNFVILKENIKKYIRKVSTLEGILPILPVNKYFSRPGDTNRRLKYTKISLVSLDVNGSLLTTGNIDLFK